MYVAQQLLDLDRVTVNVHTSTRDARAVHKGDHLGKVLVQLHVRRVILLYVQALLYVRPVRWWRLVAYAQHGKDAIAREKGLVLKCVRATKVKHSITRGSLTRGGRRSQSALYHCDVRKRRDTCAGEVHEVEIIVFSSIPPMVFSNTEGHFYTKRRQSPNHPALNLRA